MNNLTNSDLVSIYKQISCLYIFLVNCKETEFDIFKKNRPPYVWYWQSLHSRNI